MDISIFPVVCLSILVIYLRVCNETGQHKKMWKNKISPEIYGATYSGYFKLATKLELGMGITDENLSLCHGISY